MQHDVAMLATWYTETLSCVKEEWDWLLTFPLPTGRLNMPPSEWVVLKGMRELRETEIALCSQSYESPQNSGGSRRLDRSSVNCLSRI